MNNWGISDIIHIYDYFEKYESDSTNSRYLLF